MPSSNSRTGELVFARKMREFGFGVEDVSGNPAYFDKDIDFIVTSPSGASRTFEVKWDSRINQTNNLYLELTNTHSKDGAGWFCFCQADFLAYGDAITKTFYIIPLDELRAKTERPPQRYGNCGQDSIGLLINLKDIQDIITIL